MERFVLRIFVPGNHDSDAESVEREWKTLRVLEEHSIAAPRPVFLDAAGRFFGAPAQVTSRLEGGPLLRPRSWPSFLHQLAAAAAQVHTLTPDIAGLQHLTPFQRPEVVGKVAGPLDERLRADSLAEQAWLTLWARAGGLAWPRPCLVHSDYWPGNAVWRRGRLTGVVDWSSAKLGDRRCDVAQCRVDLALMYGLEPADAFAQAYAGVAGASSLRDLWFWDVHLSLHALASLQYYEDSYFDLGLRDQTTEHRRGRLEAFLRRALAGAS